MTAHSLFLYFGMVAIATLSPGPAVMFISTNSALYGWKKSVFAAIGNIAGLLCMGIISVSGLGTILLASQTIFNIVKYIGAAYLIYMGVKMIVQSKEPSKLSSTDLVDISSKKLFFKAFGVAISNPKAIIFLTALFPQFINTHENIPVQFLSLITILIAFSFCSLMTYAILASQTRNWLNNSKRIKGINRIGGIAFIGFGILLASSRE